MIILLQRIHPYFRIVGILIFFGLLSGCAVGQCIAWEDLPVTRSLCSVGSAHNGCERPSTANTYTTIEKICTARVTQETDESIAKATNP